MSATLTLQEAARMMREAVKDKSYRTTPLGLEVARYLRWKRNEWGAMPTTLVDYESILAKLAIHHADLGLRDLAPPVGTERLRECWDHYWAERAGRTRSKVRSVWVDFFDWAVRERDLSGNPARALAAPKKRHVLREGFSEAFVERVLAEQVYPADRLGCELLLRYALRKSELAAVQFKHFDFESRRLTIVKAKGGKIRHVRIVRPAFWRHLEAFRLAYGFDADNYLMPCAQDTRNRRVPLELADEILDLGGGRRQGYARATTYRHDREPSGKRMHLWWYRCLAKAGVVPEGTTSGMNMHRGRHTAATRILRKTGNIVAAQKLLGHEDPGTTSEFYAQFDDADLERVLLTVYEADLADR